MTIFYHGTIFTMYLIRMFINTFILGKFIIMNECGNKNPCSHKMAKKRTLKVKLVFIGGTKYRLKTWSECLPVTELKLYE